jgi:hypothetical protein
MVYKSESSTLPFLSITSNTTYQENSLYISQSLIADTVKSTASQRFIVSFTSIENQSISANTVLHKSTKTTKGNTDTNLLKNFIIIFNVIKLIMCLFVLI